MATRTTVILDEASKRAAKILAARLDISPSEAIRRALIHYHDQIVGVSADTRRRRQAAFDRLIVLFEKNDAAAEIARLKKEDPFF
jgi:hypothetical protein